MEILNLPSQYPHAIFVAAASFIAVGITQNYPVLTFTGCIFFLTWGLIFGISLISSYDKSHLTFDSGEKIELFLMIYGLFSLIVVGVIIYRFFGITIFPK